MNIIVVSLNEIKGPHPRYTDLFVPKVMDEMPGLRQSLKKGGRKNPIHLMLKIEGENPGYYIVDGVSTVEIYKTIGKVEIHAIVHDWEDDPMHLMIDLNTNEYSCSKELYLMAEACWKRWAPGQGKRTDISGKMKEGDTYKRIAMRLKIKSSHFIKQLLRVGRTQESYFIDIDAGLTPLDLAYRDCIEIEKKKVQNKNAQVSKVNVQPGDENIPAVGEHMSTMTIIPEFTEPDTTDEEDPAIKYQYQNGNTKHVDSVIKKIDKLTDDENRQLFRSLSVDHNVCVCCGKPIENDGMEDVQS